jgi:hypothetical protein
VAAALHAVPSRNATEPEPVNVDGQRLVIDAFSLPATPEVDRQEIDDIIASITFG